MITDETGEVKPDVENEPKPGTSLPWRVEGGGCVVQDRRISQDARHGPYDVAHFLWIMTDSGQANLDYALHACNNYPEVKRRLDVCVEALKACRAKLWERANDGLDASYTMQFVEIADDALAECGLMGGAK